MNKRKKNNKVFWLQVGLFVCTSATTTLKTTFNNNINNNMNITATIDSIGTEEIKLCKSYFLFVSDRKKKEKKMFKTEQRIAEMPCRRQLLVITKCRQCIILLFMCNQSREIIL